MSVRFWIFLCVVLGGFSISYRKPAARNLFLLAASLCLYAFIGKAMAAVAAVAVVVNYAIGLRLEKRSGKAWFGFGIFLNLLSAAGFNLWKLCLKEGAVPTGVWGEILPAVGISFICLHAIGYLTDIQRGNIAACRNIVDFGLYLLFFPKLIAGPVVRAGEFLPQLQKSYMLSGKEFSTALGLILFGLIKKTIADFLAFNFVNPVFAEPSPYTSLEIWMAVYAGAIRVYADISGYTDMAVGIAMLFDIHLPANFRSPYKASCLTDFWHRWHISLSTWFRDYVYIPSGGSRHGWFRTGIALMLTFILVGLWHGFDVGLAAWGILNGVVLFGEKLVGYDRFVNRNRLTRILGWLLCFHWVCLGWVFFTAPSLQNVLEIFSGLFAPTDLSLVVPIVRQYRLLFLVIAAVAAFMLLVKERRKENLLRLFYRCPTWVKFLVAFALVLILMNLRRIVPQDFIYFG